MTHTLDSVGSNIDDHCAFLDPIALDKLGTTDGNNEDIGSLNDLGQVGGSGMAKSHCAVVLGQQAKDGSTLGEGEERKRATF